MEREIGKQGQKRVSRTLVELRNKEARQGLALGPRTKQVRYHEIFLKELQP